MAKSLTINKYDDDTGELIESRDVIAYSTTEKDLAAIRSTVELECNEICYSGGSTPQQYINVPCSFDIETTTCNIGTRIEPKWTAFMYHWQMCIGTTVIFGRYWDEVMLLFEWLEKVLHLSENNRLVIYAHFAAYEFQFLRNFIYVESIFARKKRGVIKAQFNYCFELRCSWALSNMGLAKAIQNTPGAFFNKQSGDDFDYLKLRTPSTPMTDEELIYCYCDVRGLNEYLYHMLEEDTIGSMPLTSTGFIRRECRKAVQKNPKNAQELKALSLSPPLYVLCKTGSRGGNCHGNALYTGIILDETGSYDRKSSYPAEMMVDLFPVTKFRAITPTEENLYSEIQEKACLIEVTFWDMILKPDVPIPYISISKCVRSPSRKIDGADSILIDNGRVVRAVYLTMVITDIDFKIIMSQYHVHGGLEISQLLTAQYGHLNDEFRLYLLDLFKEKCRLEFGDKYLYNKFKNKINAMFGMMLTDICSPEIIYDPMALSPKDVWKEGEIDIDAMLNRYYSSRNSFLSYQHGMWVTANARYRHQQGIDACGIDTVYGDTDSVKFIGDHAKDFQRLNEEWLALCDNNDIPVSVTVNGKTTTLGVWEQEKTADQFVFLGAKKYAYTINGKIYITVAGLNKEKGAKWLANNGGLDAFQIDTEIPPKFSGRTTSYYIDVDEPYELTINGETFVTGSAIAAVPTTYKFGVTEEYYEYYTSVQ